MLTHFSLFSGIGGADLAAEWAGFTTVGQVEFADYPTKVLEKHWSNVPRWRDIHDVTGDEVKRITGLQTIDVICGGDPCQPHSTANANRKGAEDERFLWPEMFRLIKEIRPNWVINENVVGSISNGIVLRKINEMESEGYNCAVFSIPAFAVGAWHFRQRVFIIANSNSHRLQGGEETGNLGEDWKNRKEQSSRLYSSHSFDSDSITESQEDSYFNPLREKWNTWKDITQELGGTLPRTYWTLSEPPIPGVDDGIRNRMERSRALGNAIVPQQIYPIFKAIADIESSNTYTNNNTSILNYTPF